MNAQTNFETETKPDLVMQTFIRCTQDALWAALTDPDQIEHFHFVPCKGEMRDGKVHMVTPDGSILMTEMVTKATPKTRLETAFEPFWEEGLPVSRVVYEIEPEGTSCRLKISHYGMAGRTDGFEDGWCRWAAGLKSWLETGQPVRFTSNPEAQL